MVRECTLKCEESNAILRELLKNFYNVDRPFMLIRHKRPVDSKLKKITIVLLSRSIYTMESITIVIDCVALHLDAPDDI